MTVSFLSLLTVHYMNAGCKLQELLILLLTTALTNVTVSFLSLLTVHYMNADGKLQELILWLFSTVLNNCDCFFPFIADCTLHEYSW